MTADEYLAEMIRRNPALGRNPEETVTVRVRELTGMIRQAWEKGAEHERDKRHVGDLFDGIFGKGRSY